jgi:hypothetical protein
MDFLIARQSVSGISVVSLPIERRKWLLGSHVFCVLVVKQNPFQEMPNKIMNSVFPVKNRSKEKSRLYPLPKCSLTDALVKRLSPQMNPSVSPSGHAGHTFKSSLLVSAACIRQ